ncbi:bifunctional RNase H/acid phosphatase, partial [Streptomyces sp. ISL-36]|uniref:bifunctional RNase H/acid phosphatase n=1 Tax=Streptomyces sp. ISL-36 TaxID=2819182 RepID=UPI002035C86C
ARARAALAAGGEAGAGAGAGGRTGPVAGGAAGQPDDGLFAADEAVAAQARASLAAAGTAERETAGSDSALRRRAEGDVPTTPGTGAAASSGDFEAEAGLATHAGRTRPASATDHADGTGRASAQDRPAAGAVPAPATGRATAPGWGAPDLGAPATFVLLRHGETALTPEKRFSGSGGSDPELSAAGLRQADAVATALAARGTVQEIVSSPLKRCRQTAETVAARLGLDVRIEDGLRETDFGAWEGLTFAEVRERYPEDLDAWLASPKAAPTGGGESFATVARRVSATRDRLTAASAGRTVLLVTHVTPIKTLVRLALGAPPESLFRMELSAASLSAVAYYADGNASVRLLNDTSHLR